MGFVTDLTDLPFPKSDLNPVPVGADPDKFQTAAEWNTLCQAVVDLRTFVLGEGQDNLWGLLGDSNAFGLGSDLTKTSGEFGVGIPDPTVTFNHLYAVNDNDPPTFTEQTTGPLRTFSNGGIDKFGPERTMGQTLFRALGSPWIVKFCVVGSSAAQWASSSTFYLASTGKNLYNTWRDRMLSFVAVSGRKLGGVVINLGSADAITLLDTGNLTTNPIAIMNQIRADFGDQVVFVWLQVHALLTLAVSPNRDAARANLITALTGYPNARLVNVDSDANQVSDLVHFDSDSLLVVGEDAAFGLLDLRGEPREAVAVTPRIVGFGPTAFGGASTLKPRSWPGTQDGDTLLMPVFCYWLAGSPADTATPAGWTLVTNATCTVSGVTCRYALFKKSVLQSELDLNGGRTALVSVVVGGGENLAQIFSVRGPNRLPAVKQSLAFTTAATGMGPFAAAGVTTTDDNAGVFVFVATEAGGSGATNSVTATNATLTDFVRVKDAPYGMPTSDFDNLAAFGGELPVHGPSGTSQVSATVNSFAVGITVAVAP